MTPPVAPPGTFVLRRSAHLEERARRALTVSLVTQIAGLVLLVAATAGLVALAVYVSPVVLMGAALCLIAVVAALVALRGVVRWRRVERGLAGMELWIAPEGVAYVSVAGHFPAPWSAVRALYFRGRPGGRGRNAEALFADVDGWGGPLAEYATRGKPCSLRMPLAGLGVDRATIARAVHEISAGRVTVGVR